MTNLANQTAFRRNHVRNCGDKTDVVFRKTSDPRLRGLYDCLSEDGVVGPGCQKAIVYMNPANLSDDRNRDKTACHEVGHSGGLSHSSDASDCMISGPVSQGHRDYNNHHVNHLNNNAAKIGLD